MAAVLHDLLGVRRQGRAAAVNLDPDLDVCIGGGLATGDERFANLFEGLLDRHLLRQIVRPNFDPPAAEVGDQLDKLFARLDVVLDHGRVGRVELADRSTAPDVDARVGKAFADLLTLGFAQGRFHAMLVRRAELNRG